MKIALAQINLTVGDFQPNYDKIVSYIKKAKKEKAEIVIFPELSLCGYPPEDLVFKNSFLKANKEYLNKLKKHTEGILCIAGFIDNAGGRIFNSAAVIYDKKIQNIYHKIALPNYGVFDEKRHFSAGNSLYIYEWKNIRFSLTICEDIWQKDDGITARLRQDNLDFLVNISASPFSLNKLEDRKRVLAKTAKQIQAFVFYCNLIGGQDEIVFDGASKITSPQGEIVAMAPQFKEKLLLFEFTKKGKLSRTIKISDREKNSSTLSGKNPLTEQTSHTNNSINPPPAGSSNEVNIPQTKQIYHALILGLKDYIRKNGFQKAVIGISGGIDSALVAALAVKTVGKSKVYGLIMPSQYTSSETLKDAVKLCKNLGIKYYVLPISEIFKIYKEALDKTILLSGNDLTEQNIQARIRGNILMAFSNKHNCLVLNTGNKSEISLGYCTLYGDMIGGFGLLKDVYKTTVYKLADFINKNEAWPIIPKSIIKRAPSAELKPGQKDENELPASYTLLDKILKLYIEENLSLEEIAKKGIPQNIARKVIFKVDKNEYKRRQSPPGVKITNMAFGKDRRMPITNKFTGR